jgi:galactan endo-1,6-beta-galactosidase
MFYTLGTVSYGGNSYPGLGMNIVRYNAGACSWQPANGEKMAISGNITRYRQIEGYWLDWNSSNPASSSWNWWVDSNQRNMLWKARDRGANLFELFSNSPMWWMCYYHNPSGHPMGWTNLQSWNYRQHAVYLATVAKYAHDNWGVNFTSVEAFNEPSGPWWTDTGTQEGCHVDWSIQEQVVGYLRAELDARGLTRTLVAASDENTYDAATATWNSFAPATKSRVGVVNVHGYQSDNTGGPRNTLYGAVGGKKLWQSEYGEGYNHGLYLAYNLALDMRFLHPTAWCYWQPVDIPSWALVGATFDTGQPTNNPAPPTGTLGAVTNKYFVFAQYSRHIRPNMLIIDSGDQSTVAAYDLANKRIVLVTVRGDTAQQITYDLSRFSTVGGAAGGRIRSWTTDANPNGTIGRQYVTGTTYLNGKQFTANFPAYTIQTFEIDNVTI